MRTKLLILAVLALLLAITGPACGQSLFTASQAQLAAVSSSGDFITTAGHATRVPPMAFDSANARKAADWTSSGIIGAQATEAVLKAAHSGARVQTELYCLAARAVLVVGTSAGLKALVHKQRPDGSDYKSWPSGHAMWSVMLTDGKWSYAAPIAVSAGRILAGRHDFWDVIGGGLLGQGIKMIPCEAK